MKINLEQKYIDFIINILDKYFPEQNVEYFIFGSRAKKTNKKYSDVDIALKQNNNNKISTNILAKISIEFEDSIYPYEVDIIDLNSIKDDFKTLIKDDLIKIK